MAIRVSALQHRQQVQLLELKYWCRHLERYDAEDTLCPQPLTCVRRKKNTCKCGQNKNSTSKKNVHYTLNPCVANV